MFWLGYSDNGWRSYAEFIQRVIVVVHLLLALGLEVDDPLPPSRKKQISQSSDKMPSKLPR